ncbi:hypothetical protein Cs7R123_48560 [Catellatospora sp. TT07R-123]|uniref:hypothetical protein n=1 Tax=Catellatospora sp. TT07R-123 TaxID=2733863 RepID=UPI001B252725|nr:hypothetical protein [Catellatospora sp. TT07R-123]GHJ47514.1 hypothetical protein Cs7R123_48560 [Catellatospora sp. TT07R-123]
MRSVFVFPAAGQAETAALLDRHCPQQRDPWLLAGCLYAGIDTEDVGHLYLDWEPEGVAALTAALGRRPGWAVQVDVSGRVDGTAEIRWLVGLLLEAGGVAMDDYSDHPWTLPEIESDTVVDGLGFFDFRT